MIQSLIVVALECKPCTAIGSNIKLIKATMQFFAQVKAMNLIKKTSNIFRVEFSIKDINFVLATNDRFYKHPNSQIIDETN